jgi:DNA-binding CsgD family transcriptional regulator
MTVREVGDLRRLHDALTISEPQAAAIDAALNLTCQAHDEAHEQVSSQLQSLNAHLRGMLAMLASVKEPLAVMKLDSGGPAEMVICSGGAAKIMAGAGEQNALDSRVKEFLKICGRAVEGRPKTELWEARAGESYRLHCTRIAGDHGKRMLLVRFKPGNPAATTEAELENTAIRRGLTPSEAKVFVLMARGLGNKEIARELNTSYHTIRAHLRNMFKTLKVSSRVEAINALRD